MVLAARPTRLRFLLERCKEMNLTPTPAQIVDILSARRCSTPGWIDIQAVIEGDQQAIVNAAGPNNLTTNGKGLYRSTVPYTYNANEEYDNAWNVAGWFRDHPDFPIEDYVAPEVEA